MSEDPHDTRLRSSLLVRTEGGLNIVIDTGPDFRQQCLRYGISSVDAVLYTHAHMDHIAGLDDIRRFNVHIEDISFTPLPLEHGPEESTCFMFPEWAYCTDCSGIPTGTARFLSEI